MISTTTSILTLAATLFFSVEAHAAITVSVERASVVETSTAGAVTIYGGMAGDQARCANPSSNTEICNSCLLTAAETSSIPLGTPDSLLLPCNERRITPNLRLLLNISSDAVDGYPSITTSDGATLLTAVSGQSTLVTKGNTAGLEIPWSTVCDKVFSLDATASGGASGVPCVSVNGFATAQLRIGMSSDNQFLLNRSTDDVRTITVVIRNSVGNPAGTSPSLAEKCDDAGANSMICYFDMGPGDEKAIARTLLAPKSSTFPSAENTQFKFVRFLLAETSFAHIHMASSFKDLPVAGSDIETFTVSPRRIEGLTNDKTYYFKTALVDAAGNVGYYTSAAMDTDCSSSPDPNSTDCKVVTPSQVVGILDKTNCFVATAAYGSPFAVELDTLRDFRDQILMRSKLGASFVRWYYENSPYYAKMILESPVARATIRAGLVPVVWFAGMTLAYGPLKSSLAFLISLIAVAAALNLARRPAIRAAAREGYTKVKENARRSLLPLLIGALMIPTAVTLTTFSSMPSAEAAPSRARSKKPRRPAQEVQPLEQPLDEDAEAPPEPEYPYPGAQGAVPTIQSTPLEDEAVDEGDNLADQASPAISNEPFPPPRPPAKPPGRFQKPKAVNEDGDFIYERSEEPPVKKYGPPKAKKFSNLPGREKPSTITADGEFRYPVKESDFSGAAGFRIGFMNPPNIKNASNGLSFKDIYGSDDVPALLTEYEYPLTRQIGRVGIKFETGIYTKQAAGRFKNPSRLAEIPEERFTFLMVPLQAMVHYRLQFADTQLFVPFVEGGGGYNGIVELRDDNKSPQFGGAPVLIAGGGVNILLDWIDRQSIRQLDNEYGINHVWFTAQYRQVIGLKSDLDLTSHLISGGITFDF